MNETLPLCKRLCLCKFLIRANDGQKLWWDSIILLIAIFNSFSIPLTLAFDQISDDFIDNQYYQIINLTGTFFFIFDIFINMNTTYYDHDGEEIDDKPKIIMNYLKGMFLIDAMSSLPLEQMDVPK